MVRRILRPAAVDALLGISPSTRWRKEKRGDFPRKVQLGPNSVGYYADEIASYQEALTRGPCPEPTHATEARRAKRAAA